MTYDAHKNFGVSLIATAPSPATSGTSLVVTAGQGTRFPAVPFNASLWPAGQNPDPSNAEIVRVTNISTDTLTITRTQESTSARTVVVGDYIAATVTAKTLTDIEAAITTGTTAENAISGDVTLTTSGTFYDGPSVSLVAGTWLVVGQVQIVDTVGAATFDAKLWDGTTVFRSGETSSAGASFSAQVSLGKIVTVGSTTTVKISVTNVSRNGGSIKAQVPSASLGNNASSISAVRLV